MRSVTVSEGVGIRDMVVRQTGEIIMTNKDKKVRCVSKNGTVITLIDTAPFDPLWCMPYLARPDSCVHEWPRRKEPRGHLLTRLQAEVE